MNECFEIYVQNSSAINIMDKINILCDDALAFIL